MAMEPAIAASLWTVLVLVASRPGLIGGVIIAVAGFEIVYLLSSLPIAFLEKHPVLRPSSVPLCSLAVLLLIGTGIQRLKRVRSSN